MSTQPYEIIAAPFKVYAAPVGEAMPAINATPAGNWALLGTSGDKNITEDGVTISHPQTLEMFRMLGTTGPVKAVRTEEDLSLSFVLADLTLEQYKHVLNLGSVSTVAAGVGTAGYKHLPIRRGLDVSERALLIKGPSPYGDGWNLQYEIPRAVHSGEPEVVFQKGEPAGLLFEFMALEDPAAASDNLRFGRIVAQNASPL
jgi:hypothetical protein